MLEHDEGNLIDQQEHRIASKTNHQQGRYYRPIETAKPLKSLLWQEFELSRMTLGWLPAVDSYEQKAKLGRFSYLHTCHMKLLQERIAELPDKLGSKEWTPKLMRTVFERLSLAPGKQTFYCGYLSLLQQTYEQYRHLLLKLDTILDAPTVDKIRHILLDRDEMENWIVEQLRFIHLEAPEQAAVAGTWEGYIASLRNAFLADDDSGPLPDHPELEPAGPVPVESTNDPNFPVYEFNDQYKKAYSDPEMSPLIGSVKQMHYINATEISAAETLAYLYYGVDGMPLDFYYDLSRHMWDEVRHSQMGVRRLEQMGYRTNDFKFFKGSPVKGYEREWYSDMYSHLTMVAEPCSFLKKRKSAEAFWQFGDVLSAIQCEYDMVDERLHVSFGMKWGPELHKRMKNEPVTVSQLMERAKLRRLKQLNDVPLEEFEKVVKDFPAFCGFSTSELKYEHY